MGIGDESLEEARQRVEEARRKRREQPAEERVEGISHSALIARAKAREEEQARRERMAEEAATHAESLDDVPHTTTTFRLARLGSSLAAVFGLRKKALRTRAALERANNAAKPWTESRDGDEFFASYARSADAYVLTSYDRGVVVAARSARDLATATEEVAASVVEHGQAWRLGPVGTRSAPSRQVPDPRR